MANGTTTVNISSLTLPTVGEYTLLDYGSLTGQGSAGFTLGSLQFAMSAKLLDVGNSLVLDVTAIDSSSCSTAHRRGTWERRIRPRTGNWSPPVRPRPTPRAITSQRLRYGRDQHRHQPAGHGHASTVQFSNNNLAYSISGTGKISGATSVVLIAAKKPGDARYQQQLHGGTYVNGGTVQLGSGGTTGSIVGTVQNNALLVFNRSDSPSFWGAISGSGYVARLVAAC